MEERDQIENYLYSTVPKVESAYEEDNIEALVKISEEMRDPEGTLCVMLRDKRAQSRQWAKREIRKSVNRLLSDYLPRLEMYADESKETGDCKELKGKMIGCLMHADYIFS